MDDATPDVDDEETAAERRLDAAGAEAAAIEGQHAERGSDAGAAGEAAPDDAADEMPVDEDAAEDVPVDEDAVDEVPVDEDAVDEVPVDEDAVDEAPVDDDVLVDAGVADDARADAASADARPGEPEPPHAPAPPAHDAPAPPTHDAAAAPSGWTGLGRAMAPRATKAQVLVGLLCAVLGFALVVQVRQNNGTNLEGMRQADLVRMLDETTGRSDALQRQASDLQAEHDQLVSGSDRRQAALDALERTATTQGILTGRLPAQGPGIVLTLSEPSGSIRPLTMLNVLEEMRNSGAEAIELNGHRITASSSFTGQPGAVVLDGAALQAPYRWTAIADPDTIATALQIPGGALAAVRNDGGQGTVERSDLVKVTAIRNVPDPVYATPVPAATP